LRADSGGINDRGVIVGEAYAAGGATAALRWAPDGSVVDLGSLSSGTRYSGAASINVHGRIVGWSMTPGGNIHAALWLAGDS